MTAISQVMDTDAGENVATDRARLEALFETHRVAVFRYVRRRAPAGVVDDVVAETFVVAWRRLDAVPAEPLPWLLGVARRTLATHNRSARRQQALIEKLASSSTGPWDDGSGGDVDESVLSALARLRPVDREAILLVTWDALTPAEAAAVLGQKPAAFRVRLHRARRRLRKHLVDPAPPSLGHPRPALEEAEC